MKTIVNFIADSNVKIFVTRNCIFVFYYLNAETLYELADHKVFDIYSEAQYYQPSVS